MATQMIKPGCAPLGLRSSTLPPCSIRRGLQAFKAPQQSRRIVCRWCSMCRSCLAQGAQAHTRNRVTEVDLEQQVEAFMKRQAELESGAAFARARDTGAVIGGDLVNDELAKSYCADIFEVLRTLKRTRDMSVAEVKLVVSIEDPRTRERRTQGMEDDRGVSRDEMAVALLEVAEGRVPKDRIALKCLWEEIAEWPFLETPIGQAADAATASTSTSSSSTSSSTPATPKASASPAAATAPSEYASILKDADTVVKPYIMGQDMRKGEKPQDLADMMPSWVGYGALYGITLIPVLLVVGTVAVLFYNSLK